MYVIGNGESRLLTDISQLTNTVACNAMCRDMYVDDLVCVDRRMVDEAHKKYNNNYKNLYTRRDWLVGRESYENLYEVPELPYKGNTRPDDSFNWGSGPYAVLIAANKSEHIKLIGFDLYGINNKTNNVYKDSDHYNDSSKSAVDPRYWIYQIGVLFQVFKDKKFTIYNKKDWILPESWNKPNVSLDNISKLV